MGDALDILKAAGFDLIVLETSGIGQSDTEIMDHSDVALYVMTPEFGAATQLEKIDMLDFADVVAINKFDKRGGAPMPCATSASNTSATTNSGKRRTTACPSSAPSPRNSTTRAPTASTGP